MVLDCIPHTRCSFTDNILPNCSPHDLKVTIHHIKPNEKMILFWQTLSVSGRRSFLFSYFSHQLYTFSVQICLVRYVSLSSSGHISNNLSSLSTVHQTHKLHQLSSQQFKICSSSSQLMSHKVLDSVAKSDVTVFRFLQISKMRQPLVLPGDRLWFLCWQVDAFCHVNVNYFISSHIKIKIKNLGV